MTKRTLLSLLIWFSLGLSAVGQFNCATSNNLVCQIPFATGASSPGATDAATHAAQAFNGPIAAQLTQLPLPSAASGTVFVVDLATKEQVPLDNLGPILTERAQTIGKNRLFLGFSFQQFNFNSIDGNSLGSIPFAYQATTGSTTNSTSQYISQIEHISFKLNQYVVVASYGVTDSTDVSVVIPIERVSIGVSTVGTQYFVGPPPDNNPLGTLPGNIGYVPGVASGFGDILLGVKHDFMGGERSEKRTHLAAGALIRLPTGDALNYLGSGAYGLNPYIVVSYYRRISPHARLGYAWNSSTILLPNDTGGRSGLPGGIQYDIGADISLLKELTLAADLLGNQYLNSPTFFSSQFQIPGYSAVPTLATHNTSYTVNDISVGLKWNPRWKSVENLVVYANVLIQLNNVGLRSDPVPMVGLSYKFKP
jgi:hypothetical protein